MGTQSASRQQIHVRSAKYSASMPNFPLAQSHSSNCLPMTRTTTTILLYAFVLCIASCEPTTGNRSTDTPPNIVLIFTDDMGWGDLGTYGHPLIRTPRLERMAREGISLTSFYTAAPVCTPSRAGLMTGRYPVRFGMEHNEGPDTEGGMPADELTMAEALKSVGYRTACFGKWHLGSVPGHMPTEHGFDEYYGILYSNDMMPPWVQTDRPLRLYRGTEPVDEYPVDQTTLTKRYTEEAIRFIRESGDEPFFVYLPHAMPHLPIYASEEFQGKSEGGRYGDTIEELDWSAGAILDALADEGKDDNTIVIFTSDNGPWRNMPPRMYETEPVERWDAGTSGPFMGEKATTWEGGHRVPAIIRWPGQLLPDRVSSEVATTMDLYTTLLNLAGAQAPDKTVDGLDIWPLLKDDAPSPHQFYHYFWLDMLQGVRDDMWKLRVLPGESESQPRVLLFDLHNDPYERYDVAADHPEVVERLKQEMVRFAEETGATLAFEP